MNLNELVHQYKEKGDESIIVLILAQARKVTWDLVNAYIKKCKHLHYEDLLQEIHLATIRAIKNYDVSKSCFSTHLRFWAKHYLNRALNKQDRMIRVPEWLIPEAKKITPIIQKFILEQGRKPSVKELSEITGEKEAKIKHILDAINAYCNTTISDNLEYCEDEGHGIEDTALEKVNQQKVEKAMSVMVREQKEIIQMSLKGLNNREIAQILNTSADSIRKKKKKSIKELKKYIGEKL